MPRDRRSRLTNVFLILVLASLVVACLLIAFFAVQILGYTHDIDNNESRDYSYHIAMIGSHTDATFMRQVFEGAKSVSEINDAVVELYMPQTSADTSLLQSRLDYASCIGVTGIIAYIDDEKSEITVPVSASGDKIPLITLGNDSLTIDRVSCIGANPYEVGKKLAKTALDLQGVVGNVLVVVNNGQNNSSKNRLLSSMQESLRDYSAVHVTIFETQQYGTIGIEDVIRDKIRSMPETNIIICLSTEDTVRVAQIIVDLNLTGKVQIIGFNEDETTLDYLKKGVVSAIISLSPRECGEKAVNALIDYIRDGYISEFITTDVKVLTRESILEQEQLDRINTGVNE